MMTLLWCLLGFWIYSMIGAAVLLIGALFMDLEVESTGDTICVLALWPLYVAIFIVYGVVIGGVWLYLEYRQWRMKRAAA